MQERGYEWTSFILPAYRSLWILMASSIHSLQFCMNGWKRATNHLLPINSSPWHFSVPAWWDQEHSKDCCPSITQVKNTALFTGCLHPSFRSSKQNTGKIQATKSKPTIFQGWYFMYNPGELLGGMGNYLLKRLILAGLMNSVLSLNEESKRGVQNLVSLSSPYLPRIFQNG